MSNITLLIGIPGSGKTSKARELLAENPKLVYLNADSIREEQYGDENCQGDGNVVFGILFSRLRQAIEDGKDILVDNTSVRKAHRKKVLSMLHSNYDIYYKVFLTPLDVCLARNAARSRVVPPTVVKDFYRILQDQLELLKTETTNIEYLYADATC